MKDTTPPSSQGEAQASEQPASWQRLVDTILPNNLNNIRQSLDKNREQAEVLIARNLQATYALLDRAKARLQSSANNLTEATTASVDASSERPAPNSMDVLSSPSLGKAPDVEQRLNHITETINARFNQLAQQIAQKSQSVAQLAMSKASSATPNDDVIEGECEKEA